VLCDWHAGKEASIGDEKCLLINSIIRGYSVDNLDQYDDEEGALGRKMPIFNNLVSTDGHTVDVSLVWPTAGPPLPDLELEDFTPELVNNHSSWHDPYLHCN
jgi:hypothetical protein